MFKLARESIKMQSPIFFKELALAYKTLRETKEPEIIEAVIRKHTNMHVSLEICNFGPAVTFKQVTKNHPLVDPIFKMYANNREIIKMISVNKELRGSVDLSNGKVYGFFENLGAVIYIPENMLSKTRYTDEEMAAMTLHEVGHVFTYCEYMVRSVTTNQVLAAMSREFSSAETEAEREVIMINTARALKLSEKGLRDLAKTSNHKVVEAVVVAAVIEDCRTELGNDIYDTTSWEYLSDEFASRFQAGKHLVTSLDKIYRDFGHISFRKTPAFIAYEAFKLLVLLASVSPLAGFALPIAIILIASDGHNPTYDMPGARMIRIKHQIVENLKDKSLPKKEVDSLLNDIEFIDSVLKEVNDKRQFLSVMWDWIVPGVGKSRDFQSMQQDLETLANNDLFISAAQFKATI